jgi:hypothetical protein
MRVERYGYLEQTRSASGIARKPWERVEKGNGFKDCAFGRTNLAASRTPCGVNRESECFL